MNKEQAIELAENIRSLYQTETNGLSTRLPSFKDKEEAMKDCYYVGVWMDDELVSTIGSYEQLEAWRKFAAIVARTDMEIIQEEVARLNAMSDLLDPLQYTGTVNVWTEDGIESR